MKPVLAASAVALSLFTVPASAELIDIATVKCSDLMSMSDGDSKFVFTWLMGYAARIERITTINLSASELYGALIGEFCGAHPDMSLLEAADGMAVMADD